jgi:hypothetical protein
MNTITKEMLKDYAQTSKLWPSDTYTCIDKRPVDFSSYTDTYEREGCIVRFDWEHIKGRVWKLSSRELGFIHERKQVAIEVNWQANYSRKYMVGKNTTSGDMLYKSRDRIEKGESKKVITIEEYNNFWDNTMRSVCGFHANTIDTEY